MKHQVYSVYDKAVGAFLPPFYCRARGEAVRSFIEAANDTQRFAKHAADYYLAYLGEFDDNSGLFASGEPQRVMSAEEASDNVLEPVRRSA